MTSKYDIPKATIEDARERIRNRDSDAFGARLGAIESSIIRSYAGTAEEDAALDRIQAERWRATRFFLRLSNELAEGRESAVSAQPVTIAAQVAKPEVESK